MELFIGFIYLSGIIALIMFTFYLFGFGGIDKIVVKRKMIKNNLKLNQRNMIEMEMAFNMVFNASFEIKERYAIWLKDEYKTFKEKIEEE